MDTSILRMGKTWQGPYFIVVQVSAAALRGKHFLVLDTATNRQRSVRLGREKPQDLKPQGNVAALVRKHLEAATITGIFAKMDGPFELWVTVTRPGSTLPWFLHMTHEPYGELTLIADDGTVYFRYSKHGTYTKRKSFPRPLPELATLRTTHADILPRLIAEATNTAEDIEEPTTDGEVNAQSKNSQMVTSQLQRDVRDRLARRLKTLRKALEKAEANVANPAEIADLERRCSLLQHYSYLITPNSDTLVLKADLIGAEHDYTIPLDPDASVGANLTQAFAELKKKRRGVQLGSGKLAESMAELKRAEADLVILRNEALSDAELLRLLSAHRLSLQRREDSGSSKAALPYRTYTGANGATFLVGRGPADNDELTKNARSNDFWFHIIDTTGSHIVIPRRSLPKGDLDPVSKREGMILAVHFSKKRSDYAGDVYVTTRGNLRKKKGMPVGLWLVERSESVFVRYSETEVQEILNRGGEVTPSNG